MCQRIHCLIRFANCLKATRLDAPILLWLRRVISKDLTPRIRVFLKIIGNIVQQIGNVELTCRMSFFAEDDKVKFIPSASSLFFELFSFFTWLLCVGCTVCNSMRKNPDGYSFLNVFGDL